MTTAVADTHAADHHDDHGPTKGIKRWLFSTNHKDIGTMYLIFSLIMFFVGGAMAMVIRSELAVPGLKIRYIVPMSLWFVENSQRLMPLVGPWSS